MIDSIYLHVNRDKARVRIIGDDGKLYSVYLYPEPDGRIHLDGAAPYYVMAKAAVVADKIAEEGWLHDDCDLTRDEMYDNLNEVI